MVGERKMKKQSEAFKAGYDYLFMIGRDNTKEIKAYFKYHGLSHKEYDELDFYLWNEYQDLDPSKGFISKKNLKEQNDFELGKNAARDEMQDFNNKLEHQSETLDNYRIAEFEGDWELWKECFDILDYCENKKDMEVLVEKYYQGLKAMQEFLTKAKLKKEYEV